MTRLILLFLLSVVSIPATRAAIRYVTPTGAGTLDGSSWANAAPGNSLQVIINASATNDQVWVAKGTYLTTTTSNRAVAFSLKNGVALYGGFAGNETALTQRVLSCGSESILSGEIGGAGTDDNSHHVISNASGLNNTAVIDGFVIRGANDNRPPTLTDGLGGGIYNNGSEGGTCSPTIRNCLIIANAAAYGAGIFNNGYNGGTSNPMIINCIITENTAYIGGGGIDNFGLAGNASPTISNSIVYKNSAVQRAGGMYCWGGNNGNASPTITHCSFVNNTAVDGGGIVIDRLNASGGSSGTSNPIILNSIFWGNSVTGAGPQFFTLGGAIFTSTYSTIDQTGQTTPHTVTGTATGNIYQDPKFVNVTNAAGPDGCWLTTDDGLRLTSSSPAINTGSNTGIEANDIAGNLRVIGNTTDMGPYERDGEEPVITAVEETFLSLARIFPNPGRTDLHIESNAGTHNIYLANVLGEIIFRDSSNDTHDVLNVSELPRGIYILTITQNGLAQKFKWLKE